MAWWSWGLWALAVVLAWRAVGAERRDDRKGLAFFKPAATLVLCLMVLIRALLGAAGAVVWLVVLALAFSVGGDVALLRRDDRSFLVGLGFFLMAHLAYAGSFSLRLSWRPSDLSWGLAVLGLVAVVYAALWGGLGRMRVPAALYALAIGLMLFRALVFGRRGSVQGMLTALGAVLFFVSDTLLAFGRFRRRRRAERYVLPTYYAAQALLALSVHAEGWRWP